jgi:tetratricopeptide (TPR) repeat protein
MECLGQIAYYADDQDEATRWFERAIAANEKNAHHHSWLGKSLVRQVSSVSKFRLPFVARRMRGEFERAIVLDSTLVEAHEGLLGYYLQAPSVFGGSIDRARAEAKIVVGLNPMRGHIDLAGIFAHGKDSAAAEGELRTAADVSARDSSAAFVALGAFYSSARRWADAFDVYDRGLAANPSAGMLRLQYGRAAALSGTNLERGEQELVRWLVESGERAAPVTRADAHVSLAQIYATQGRVAAAKAEYEQALSLVPAHAEATRGLKQLRRTDSDPRMFTGS